jgi:hypothetical protein
LLDLSRDFRPDFQELAAFYIEMLASRLFIEWPKRPTENSDSKDGSSAFDIQNAPAKVEDIFRE